jgi:hypothetical protein
VNLRSSFKAFEMAELCLDWPLSKEEQKKQVLKLYDKDVRAANELLHSGEAALKALRDELRTVRSAGTLEKGVSRTNEPRTVEYLKVAPEPEEEASTEGNCNVKKASVESISKATADEAIATAEAAARLQLAIVDAAAALAALLGTKSMPTVLAGMGLVPDEPKSSERSSDIMEARQRARSEGTGRAAEPALVKGERRRRSRGGERLRVSFSGPCDEECNLSVPNLSRRSDVVEEPDPGPDSPVQDRRALNDVNSLRGVIASRMDRHSPSAEKEQSNRSDKLRRPTDSARIQKVQTNVNVTSTLSASPPQRLPSRGYPREAALLPTPIQPTTAPSGLLDFL